MPDDRRIYDYYVAGRASAALAVAVELDLFGLLDAQPSTLTELAQRLEIAERPLDLLVRALKGMGLLADDEQGQLIPAEDAAAFLVRGKPGWLGGLIGLEVENFLSPDLILRALKRNNSSVYGEDDPWATHENDPQKARAFTDAMHSISERPAAALASVFDFGRHRKLLDLGGGSGAISIAIAKAWPQIICAVLDLAPVCDFADENILAAQLADRVTTISADFFSDLPAGYDIALLSQILHDWSPKDGAALLARCFEALEPGGVVLIHEKLVDPDGSGPLANALVNLDMLVWTQGQQYDHITLREILLGCGFGEIECRKTTGYWSLVSARRPD